MATAFYDIAINKLGTWNYKLDGEDLSTITFYDNNGNEIAKPSDFPTNEQIETAKTEEQTRLDNIPNLKTSAINKLKGATYSALTDAEAKALFGE